MVGFIVHPLQLIKREEDFMSVRKINYVGATFPISSGETVEVVINGIRYVPVTEANADIKKIAIGLLASCLGVVSEERLTEALDDIHVSVNDWGEGLPIKDVLADIVEALGKE